MTENVGFIGIGNMGYGMAGNIRKKMSPTGILYINDILKPTCSAFVKQFSNFGPIEVVNTPKEIAQKAKTIITMLPAGAHVRRVYLDEDSIFQAPKVEDRLLLECSTIDIKTSKEVGLQFLEAGKGRYIDALVSGGVAGAATGTLSFMVGAADPTERKGDSMVTRALDIISMMAEPRKIIFGGQLGTGLAAKIVNNYIAFCTSLATAEAMSIGVRNGVCQSVGSIPLLEAAREMIHD